MTVLINIQNLVAYRLCLHCCYHNLLKNLNFCCCILLSMPLLLRHQSIIKSLFLLQPAVVLGNLLYR
ncbi:unnamed protein product [Trifolium pratense]|uniref:Uncharacterized protein n=1 Tax=Trifolium pratense TaxID=57577 RepID=A0ACB0JDR6_TRIPR|nr:unnamed protein product [Trifolium pratense]